MKAALLALLLTGCASGVRMTDAEAIECRTHSCTAWTEAEIHSLVGRAADRGYQRGWADAHRQTGRDL